MIAYLTEVDGTPVVTVNGKNLSVEVSPETQHAKRSYKVLGVTVYADYTVCSYTKPFASIVLAVEIAREVIKHEESNKS